MAQRRRTLPLRMLLRIALLPLGRAARTQLATDACTAQQAAWGMCAPGLETVVEAPASEVVEIVEEPVVGRRAGPRSPRRAPLPRRRCTKR